MKAAILVTVPIVTTWNWLRDLMIQRELASPAPEVDFEVDVQIKEREKEVKKILGVLVLCVLLTGCSSFAKKQVMAETMVKIFMRDIGYRSEQIKAMAETQADNDPLMAAGIKDLAELLKPDAGIFETGLDTAAQAGFDEGVALYQSNATTDN